MTTKLQDKSGGEREKIEKLRRSYKSVEARQIVAFVFDIYKDKYSFDRVYEIIKHLAEATEYLKNKNA